MDWTSVGPGALTRQEHKEQGLGGLEMHASSQAPAMFSSLG